MTANFGEELRKLILAGIGAAAVSVEKSQDLLDQLVKKGELTVEQGKVLNEELKHNVKQAVKESVTVIPKEYEDLVENLDKLPPEERERLRKKLEMLYARENDTQEETKDAEGDKAGK